MKVQWKGLSTGVVSKLLIFLFFQKNLLTILHPANDPNGKNLDSYPVYTKLTHQKQKGGLLFTSSAVMKIVKAIEVIIRWRIVEMEKSIVFDKMINLEDSLQSLLCWEQVYSVTVLHSDHQLGQEADHLSPLTRSIVSKYLDLGLKLYGRKYTAEIAH